jgi:muconate cycloisomerase
MTATLPTTELKITQLRVTPVSLPRSHTLTTSYGSGDLATTVLVEIMTDAGITGIGQTAVAPRSYGETAEGIAVNIASHLAPAVLGKDPSNITGLLHAMQKALPHHWASHAGVELALWDVTAKALGVPAYVLLGGKLTSGVKLMGFVHQDTPAKMAEEARRVVDEQGFDVLKMKIGADPVADLERYRAVAHAIDGQAVIQVDGNIGYSLAQASHTLPQMEAIGALGAVEQPVARVADMAVLASKLTTPIMADEAIYAAPDAIEIARTGAASLALMKITKHGGVSQVRSIGTIFEAAGLGLSIAIYFDVIAAVAAHLAVSLPAVRWPSPFTYLDDTILREPYEPVGQLLPVPEAPGWGVELDPDKVNRYAVSQSVTISS